MYVRRARTITVDTNFWKCQVHDAFRLLPGNPGSLTLWGRDTEQHLMFSEHMNGEMEKLVESGSNTVYEWIDTPNDNHLFDCMVGSIVAASVWDSSWELVFNYYEAAGTATRSSVLCRF